MQKKITEQRTYKSFWYLFFNCATIGLGSLAFGFVLAEMAAIPTKQIIHQFNIPFSQAVTSGVLMGSAPIGAALGCLFSSFVLDILSRRGMLIFGSNIMIIATSLTLIGQYRTLFIGRIMQGMAMGIYTSICPLFMRQLSPKQISHYFGIMHHFMSVGGILLTVLFSLAVDDKSDQITPIWFILFACPLVFALFQILLLEFFFQNQSPRYLILQGREADAYKLIEKIYKEEQVNGVYQQQVEQAKVFQDIQDQQQPHDQSFWLRIFLAMHILNFHQYCGTNIAMLYCKPILREIIGSTTAKQVQITIILIKVASVLITLKALSNMGNKKLIQMGILACIIFNLLLSIGSTLPQGSAKSCLIVGSIISLILVFNFTIGPVLWTYVPNIIHPKFIPIVTFIHWIFSSVMLFVFPIAKQHLDSMYIFLFQATLGAAAMLINQVAMVDTNDRSHQEIKEEFDKLFTAE